MASVHRLNVDDSDGDSSLRARALLHCGKPQFRAFPLARIYFGVSDLD